MTTEVTSDVMRAYPLRSFGGPDVLRMEDVPVPAPGHGQVLVRVEACGVCGQDVMRRRGEVDRMLGAVIGHELAGVVVGVGPGVTTWALGDRVAGTQRRSCHRCAACLRGETVLCRTGILYGEAIDGGYADFCVVDELSLAAIPDTVSFDEAAVAACAVGTGLHALRLAGTRAGQRVLVTGATGGVGVHALQLARTMGAEVVAVTRSEHNVERLNRYADHVVATGGGGFDHEVRRRSLQPDVILDLTAKYTLGESLRSVERGGTVVIVGNLENGPVDILPAAFIIREIRLLGSKAATVLELQDCLRFIARGQVEVQLAAPMPLDDASKAHELMETSTPEGRIVLRP